MKTVAQLLKHDFSKGSLYLYDSNGNRIYSENSNGYWFKRDYDSNCNEIYFEDSDGYWHKREYDSNGNVIYCDYSDGFWHKSDYDSNGNEIYFEDSDGNIIDNRPKTSCDGKVVEIDGKQYKLVELKPKQIR
jgi:hypothetical protein